MCRADARAINEGYNRIDSASILTLCPYWDVKHSYVILAMVARPTWRPLKKPGAWSMWTYPLPPPTPIYAIAPSQFVVSASTSSSRPRCESVRYSAVGQWFPPGIAYSGYLYTTTNTIYSMFYFSTTTPFRGIGGITK